MSGGKLTRRALLARSGVAAGAVVGTAGCSGLFGSDDDGTAAFTRWLPAPAAVANADHYRFEYYDLATLAANRDRLGGEPTVFEQTWQPVELGWTDATAVVSVDSVDVVTAEFDRDGAVSELRGAGYDRAGEYEGYVRYRDPETGTVFALTDGTMLVSSVDRYATDAVDPSDRIQTVVDARTGDVDRYAEAIEDMDALVEALGAGTLVRGTTMDDPDAAAARSGRFENLVAEGSRSVFDGGTVEVTWVYLYDRPRDVDTATLERYVEENDDSSDGVDARFAGVEDISYTQEERKGIITGTRDASEYYS